MVGNEYTRSVPKIYRRGKELADTGTRGFVERYRVRVVSKQKGLEEEGEEEERKEETETLTITCTTMLDALSPLTYNLHLLVGGERDSSPRFFWCKCALSDVVLRVEVHAMIPIWCTRKMVCLTIAIDEFRY